MIEDLTDAPARPGSDDRARAAADAARRRSGRAWARFGVALTVLLLLLFAFIARVWHTSEIRAVHIRTSSQPGTPLPVAPLPERLRTSWHTTDQLAVGAPVWQDVVVTWSERTVTGRDARTGAVRWSYTRTDRRMCSVAQEDGIAVAIYAHDGNCDEATGLDAVSGDRQWVRTLFDNGTAMTVSATPGQILLATPTATHLLDPTGGLDYWYDVQSAGCRTGSAALGTAGVLLASICPGGKDTLSLRGSGSSKGRDWSVPLAGRVPLAADAVLVALRPGGRYADILGPKGATTGSATLPSAERAPARPAALYDDKAAAEVVTVSGGVFVVRSDAVVRWTRSAGALPADTGGSLLVATRDEVETVSVATGRVTRRTTAPGLRPGDRVAALGDGIVAGNDTGTTVFG